MSQAKHDIPTIQKVIAVLWPSFLIAGVATVLFFTTFDPEHVFADYTVSRIGAYSIGFFFFWLVSAGASMMSLFFARPCPSIKKDA